MLDPNTATTDVLRDWLAKEFGWRVVADDGNLQRTAWINEMYNGDPTNGKTIIVTREGEDVHPIPATLDAAAAAMPEGWWWERSKEEDEGDFLPGGWRAYHPRRSYVHIIDTGDEIRDRFALAVACRIAQGDAR